MDKLRILLAIVIILGSFATAALFTDYYRFSKLPLTAIAENTSLTITQGESISSLANTFYQRGWIRHPFYLKVFARQHQLTAIKAGHYELSPQMTVAQILNRFVDADVKMQQATIIEGWSFRQMRALIASLDDVEQTLVAATDAEIMALLGAEGLHPEGQFLPDTYRYAPGSEDIALYRAAYQAMQQTLADAWQQRQQQLPIKTPYEALTLASIVEKETGAAHERALIAGVFISRLRKNMKLQTDPTVIYGMGERFKGNIKRKHLREDTPYNTYVHKGLTPTPISLPGQAAITAALNPDEQGYLYFVAKGDGTHYFSKTLKEHNQAVRKYQLKK
mgnify:CR=1 FL=1